MLRKNVVILLFIFGLGAAQVVNASGERLRSFLAGLRSLQADFEQVLLDENGVILEEAKGTLRLARPGRFRWDYREPYPQLIVADGKNVWIYDSELAQVTVKPLGEAVGNTPALLLTSDQPLEERFQLRDLDTQDGLDWLELKPKTPDVSFSRIQLGFRGTELQKMELEDSFGQLTKLRFYRIVKNARVDPLSFSFTPPAGVDVIGDIQ